MKIGTNDNSFRVGNKNITLSDEGILVDTLDESGRVIASKAVAYEENVAADRFYGEVLHSVRKAS